MEILQNSIDNMEVVIYSSSVIVQLTELAVKHYWLS